MRNISIIVPTYNEKDNIGKMIEVLGKYFPQGEIIVIDDNSPDETWRIVREMTSCYTNLRLLRRRKRGLASAIRDGIDMSKGDIIVWMDCDFSMPPDIINRLVDCITNSYDIAVASRYISQGMDTRDSRVRIWASRFINGLARRLLDSSITDLTSGFVACKRAVLNQIDIRGDYGEYCIDFLFHAEKRGLKIKEVPYKCLPRSKGYTKTAPNFMAFLILGVRYFIAIFKLRIGIKNA